MYSKCSFGLPKKADQMLTQQQHGLVKVIKSTLDWVVCMQVIQLAQKGAHSEFLPKGLVAHTRPSFMDHREVH